MQTFLLGSISSYNLSQTVLYIRNLVANEATPIQLVIEQRDISQSIIFVEGRGRYSTVSGMLGMRGNCVCDPHNEQCSQAYQQYVPITPQGIDDYRPPNWPFEITT